MNNNNNMAATKLPLSYRKRMTKVGTFHAVAAAVKHFNLHVLKVRRRSGLGNVWDRKKHTKK